MVLPRFQHLRLSPLRIPVRYLLLCLLQLLSIISIPHSVSGSDLENTRSNNTTVTLEICEQEAVNISCGNDEVIVIVKAYLGRMRLGKCVKIDFGFIGCKSNVVPFVAEKCTGKRQCRFAFSRSKFEENPCLGDLSLYLEVTYACLKDCFLPDLKPTTICSAAIDKHLREFINRYDYRSACRLISTGIHCYHNIKNNTQNRCSEEVADEYDQIFILPFVEEVREVVVTKCSLVSPYVNYFLTSSTSASTLSNSHLSYIKATVSSPSASVRATFQLCWLPAVLPLTCFAFFKVHIF